MEGQALWHAAFHLLMSSSIERFKSMNWHKKCQQNCAQSIGGQSPPFNCPVVFSDHALHGQMWRIVSADMGENALQFVEGVVADDQLALALGAVFYLHW